MTGGLKQLLFIIRLKVPGNQNCQRQNDKNRHLAGTKTKTTHKTAIGVRIVTLIDYTEAEKHCPLTLIELKDGGTILYQGRE
jgi:hypothetical protein